ncbi:hypothetical protein MYCTH_89922 [Thermothelomyces thermophilus ATCC 42464]|uniref:C2H2-type domain-containing protein n=1 Tax=Thermothelomyces thermophilus (strain ATCC 42464 / BCRC 31852 / DSM 1799) TaxID=573729 RepID=G2Q1L6_THET4|nr:uncharacterized protein MYCTH_89922 [Thermothelomyces thermophilus ATCC 42464]AEO55007.1 hypothetical protein MYCTH_89922 [Thermothelomyces thermophilus ATCC 42464]
MSGRKSDSCQGHRSSKPPTHQDVASQMSNLSLGAAPQQQQYQCAQAQQYQYANPQDFGRHAQPGPKTTGSYYAPQAEPVPAHDSSQSAYGPYAPSDTQLAAAYKALAKWEKIVKGPPFKVRYPKWTHDAPPPETSQSSSTAPAQKVPTGKYKCSCGKTYSGKDDLKAHLSKHKSYKQVK